jgi:hypothetical protein
MGYLQIFAPGGIIVHENIRTSTAIEWISKIPDGISWRWFTDKKVITHGFVECASFCKGRWNRGCYFCTLTKMGKLTPKEIINLIN